jgi:hypothetical protein
MKNLRYYLLAVIAFAGCEQQQTAHTETTTTSTVTTADTIKKPAADKFKAYVLIIPGKSIGNTSLNEPADSVLLRFGKPDAGDAAMGKSLSTWYAGHDTTGYQIDVFFSRKMGTQDDVSRVKQVRVTSPDFKTAEGSGVGSSLAQISSVYKVNKTATYHENGQAFGIYDDAEKGIAFEVDNNEKCTGVILHDAGKPMDSNYLPFHPGIKMLK